ncbi:hypothetical protein [Candidatus Microthrix parvicella]|uniref:hypothetical protein n=1 Tax=Candidatus Neomicrothrix parvicella TaxID=41950 RepID=UPI00037635EC|nr:hypothetical protein [Candidatus Microthrix parvicella]
MIRQMKRNQWRRRVAGARKGAGFSTISIAFVLLALTIPMVMIAESTLVAARQATGNALGQENLRAIDGAMSEVIAEVRLDPEAAKTGGGCQGSPHPATVVFERDQLRPSQSTLDLDINCSIHKVGSAGRILDFEAMVGTSKLGEARVRYVDRFGSDPEPGFEMLVCDWQLGNNDKPLAECPAVPAGP